MKRFLAILVLAGLAISQGVYAQEYVPTPVTISKEKVRLNGKVYLSHVVLEKQTIYGITKAYGITEDALYEANPSLRETGLQKNAIILIPYNETTVSETPKATAATPPPSGEYREHKVRWFEDIEDIAKLYGVSVREIMDFNGLKSRKVTARQVLRIPLLGNESEAVEQPAAAQETDVAQTVPETAEPQPEVPSDTLVVTIPEEPVQPEPKVIAEIPGGHSVEAALILPLNASGKVSEANMDFYCGALMALRDLEASGVRAKVHIYDLYAGVPSSAELARCDFVLGPVTSRDLEAILLRVGGQTTVISPLDQKAVSLCASQTNFIQAPSSADNQYASLVEWLEADRQTGDRVLLITEKNAKSTAAAVSIRQALSQSGTSYEILNYAIVEGRGIPSTLAEKMDKGVVNRVVVASESEAFIGDVMRNLGIMMGRGYQLVMYAPSKVRTFDTIEGSSYHQASLHLCSAYYADYKDPSVNAFVLAYRALYNTEPSQFAFQGYDTARFFISRAARYGQNWMKSLGSERESGLHTDFFFAPKGDKTFANTAVRRILYKKDYSTVIVR